MLVLRSQHIDCTGESGKVAYGVKEKLSAESVMFSTTAIYDGPRYLFIGGEVNMRKSDIVFDLLKEDSWRNGSMNRINEYNGVLCKSHSSHASDHGMLKR